MTSSTVAASFTVRAIGPTVSMVGLDGNTPWRLTSATVGRSPTRLPTEAGPRMEPPVSSPIPTVAKLAAIPAPVPPDDPLAWRLRSYGFRIGPDAEPAYPEANSPIVAFAMMIAP